MNICPTVLHPFPDQNPQLVHDFITYISSGLKINISASTIKLKVIR